MSKLSSRSRPFSERGRISQRGLREKNYKLFLVHFHGTGLVPIRERFVEHVKDGLRRKVLIIDMDEEVKEYRKLFRKSRSTRQDSLQYSVDELAVALAAIEQRRQQYEDITKQIESEQRFDLFEYWLENIPTTQRTTNLKGTKNGATSKKPLDKIPEKSDKKKQKSARPSQFPAKPVELVCPVTVAKEHNRVGKEKPIAKRKYIEDEPLSAKLFIVLLGSNTKKLYLDLLRANEPMQAIIHYIPEKTAYDRLVPRPSYEKYLRCIVQDVKSSFDSLRIPNIMKPVGLLQQPLPVISRCLAQKYAAQIYDELSWHLYDVELLHQYYQLYYVAPFVETNVEMDRRVKIQDLVNTVQSLNIQGHFLKSPIPAAATDVASIVMFLEGLISTVQLPDEALPEYQALLSTGLWTTSIFSSHGALASTFKNAFNSITKIKRFERLVIDRNNPLLSSLVSYMSFDRFSNIHQSCLEYNIVRRYILSTYVMDCVRVNPPEKELEPFFLPQFCKLFLSHDSVIQRLTQLLTEYNHYQVDILHPGYILYHFRRRYNEVVHQQRMMILPTRLCFRDFTLFQMEAFLKDLVTKEYRKSDIESQKLKDINVIQRKPSFSIDANIFIRPKSLKAQKLQRLTQDNDLNAGIQGNARRKTGLEEERRTSQADFVGLPPGHPLLQGYNLEDVHQEICINSSLYHFEEGHLKLYEDRVCMNDVNKNIHLKINQCSINFCRPQRWQQGISRNIQIRTRNDITCRVFGKEDECAQIVLNYPNSLVVFFHSDYSEQMWNLQDTVNDEARRLMIPEGAVIVHYRPEDVVRILRHNGEVYELFQYELVAEEEEEEEEEEDSFVQTSIDPTTQNSENLGDGITRQSKFKTIPRLGTENFTGEVLIKPKSKKRRKEMLLHSIKHELRFVNNITARYGLNYLHLKVTTTVGRRVELTLKGKVFERRSLENKEWHDYFANESYAMRSDGVKLIWTKDALKCFHSDGTIITTGLKDIIENIYWEDEFDSRISGSSSHKMEEAEENERVEKSSSQAATKSQSTTKMGAKSLGKTTTKAKGHVQFYEKYILHEIEEEHLPAEDTRYVCYQNDKFLIQHKCYAAVNFLILNDYINDIHVLMNIFAADNIQVQISLEDLEQNTLSGGDDEADASDITASDRCKPKSTVLYAKHIDGIAEQMLEIPKPAIKISIGDDVEIKVTDDCCQINALVERYDKKCGKLRDILSLGFQFDDDICSLFQEFVQIISTFKNYRKPAYSDLYFLQKNNDDCTNFQGFEFYRHLPQLGDYSFSAGNATIDMRGFCNVTALMSNKYEWLEQDMKKFPHFQSRKPKPRFSIDVPRVMAVDFYCKIPRRLLNSEEIKKFLEPFDTITFKRTRVHVRDALEYYLHPELRIKFQKLVSKMSWRRRHQEHRRRLLIEMQRKGFYHAMLKHKVYPKYHKFTYDFRNHVINIDFFDFVQSKCMPRL